VEEEIDGYLSIDPEADSEKSVVIERDITRDKDNILVIWENREEHPHVSEYFGAHWDAIS
jgi:hypothetical protein